MPDLSALLARVEEATEGSRELDADILATLGPSIGKQNMMWRPGAFADFDIYEHPNGSKHHALEYTRYIDSAVSLVPKGGLWAIGMGDLSYMASVEDYEAKAATAPLALCIAALKARSRP